MHAWGQFLLISILPQKISAPHQATLGGYAFWAIAKWVGGQQKLILLAHIEILGWIQATVLCTVFKESNIFNNVCLLIANSSVCLMLILSSQLKPN